MATAAGFGSSFSQMPLDKIFTFSHLTPRIKSHLCNVYLTLAAALALATVGVLADIKYHLGGQITFLVSLFGMLWLAATPPTKVNQTSRGGVLGAISFSQGCSIGPLLDAVIDVSPAIIAWATAATSTVFLCFSLAALVARRRSFLYLGGILSSAVMMLSLMRIGSMFGFGLSISFELYLGLAVFMGYVVFDTQMIVEKANRGDTDHVMHALELFQDFVSIFVRLVIILTQKEQNKSRKERRRD
mmetsp:Transcript_11311/g.20435  ORF Transcript_11311/g.20435 Transcript_11311/m.20435 type:complete len:244 (-) Transcript_11311:1210-1941(-)